MHSPDAIIAPPLIPGHQGCHGRQGCQTAGLAQRICRRKLLYMPWCFQGLCDSLSRDIFLTARLFWPFFARRPRPVRLVVDCPAMTDHCRNDSSQWQHQRILGEKTLATEARRWAMTWPVPTPVTERTPLEKTALAERRVSRDCGIGISEFSSPRALPPGHHNRSGDPLSTVEQSTGACCRISCINSVCAPNVSPFLVGLVGRPGVSKGLLQCDRNLPWSHRGGSARSVSQEVLVVCTVLCVCLCCLPGCSLYLLLSDIAPTAILL